MNAFLSQTFNQSKKLLFIFLGVTLLLNLVQAYTTGLHPDEAYYWVYSKFLDWGYFDHPPMVALYIKVGSLLFKNTLGLRLVTVFSYAASVFLLWQIVKKYSAQIQLFIILISSILIFHVYAFITTPDVPLFFFSILFLFLYQLYLKEDKFIWALALGITAAGLMLSKYHGILLILFVLLSNLKLFTRKTFYITIILAVILCLPHLYWQYLNGFPSVYYHLIDRSATPYRFDYTSQYFLDQILMMGPLVGWLLFYYGFKLKTKEDLFIRALKFVVFGVIIFFFLSTFKGRVQAQWPLIEFIALFILAYIYAAENLNHFKKYKWLFGINIFLILLARFIIMGFIPVLNKIPFVASFQNYDIWSKEVQSAAKGNPVVFQDGFQEPSYYNFYTQSLNAVAYNSIYYRQTQYDLWPLEDSIQHKKVMLIAAGEASSPNEHTLNTIKGPYHYSWIDSVRFYPKINFNPIDFPKEWNKNQKVEIEFKVSNPYQHPINFSSNHQKWACSFQYGFLKDGEVINIEKIPSTLNNLILGAKQSKNVKINIRAPSASGNYKLFISIKTEPFAGTRNSKMIGMKVR
ncbi:glycosyltransferase family 39 protein [Pelobium sp.]|nr:glycosyltransferase family 39 protein [Pelobium sp.]MDA9555021.1 glycosyltransferase family 39 protein [Pelobium sp.]